MTTSQPRSTSVFRREGDDWVPNGLAAGPWYPGTQHGSAMLGILAHALDSHESASPMQVARMTVDMMRAAPMQPVQTRVRTTRAGRSVEFLEVTLESEGEIYARANAMRFVVNPVPVPEEYRGEARDLRLPEPSGFGPPGMDEEEDYEAFHQALEIRPVPGFELPVLWLRLRVPLVEGETPSPFVRTAVAADFTYSLPNMRRATMDPDSIGNQPFASINPDTALNLHRPMTGEWVALYCHVHYAEHGAGSALAQLYDEQGVIGHASQSLLVRPIDRQPSVWRERQKQSEE